MTARDAELLDPQDCAARIGLDPQQVLQQKPDAEALSRMADLLAGRTPDALRTTGLLWQAGVRVRRSPHQDDRFRRVPLPTYPVQRSAMDGTTPVEEDRATAESSTEVEMTIAEVWWEMLGVPHVGVGGDFFELGCHSLHATPRGARRGTRDVVRPGTSLVHGRVRARHDGVHNPRDLAAARPGRLAAGPVARAMLITIGPCDRKRPPPRDGDSSQGNHRERPT
uniref:hypothetical protein n=1 Tax=Paractinoplanes polyasparticus TaxID=2856853 RepID=UPI001C84524F|nr:hypothetical protein [Actinoplanes polyasparticus]